MIERLLRRLMNAEVLGLILVTLALLTFTYGISSSIQSTNTGGFFLLCFTSAAVSFGLGKIRWNGIQASAGSVVLGVALIWILGARLTQPLLTLLHETFSLLPLIIPAIQSKTAIDTTALAETWKSSTDASAALMVRLQTWMLGTNKSVAINDALVRNMVWALILWLCSAWTGWFAHRRNAVASLLPAMMLLSFVLSYSEYRTYNLWVMLVILVALMGVWNYRNHKLQWLKQHIDYSDSIRVDSGTAVIFLTIAIGSLAFVTPSISWREVVDFVRERQGNNEAAEMLGIQEPDAPRASSSSPGASLPREYLLSGGYANSERIVMTISTGELPPMASQLLPSSPPRYYWRSVVYDRYVGTGWMTSTVTKQNISANTPLIPGLLNGYRLVHLDVQMIEPEGKLFWSGMLFSVDTPFAANWRVRPPSDLFADQGALLQADIFAASTDAGAYQAETYVPIPSLYAMRSSSTDYPEDIRLRYLPLPLSVPERVLSLADDITDGLSNPYDKARAIEVYLREKYPYDLNVPAPPDGRDVADFFLFDLKKGYCDYYATSMVVLARASGLPARFVSGYSSGSYDAPNAQYVIREMNAHSWAEVYFPEIGWVEFEPTGSQPEIERREEAAPLPAGQNNNIQTASELLTRFRVERILLWSSPLIVILTLAIIYYTLIERWLILRLAPAIAIDRVYQRFYRAARPLAGAWTRAETSSEFLRKVTFNLAGLQKRTRYKRLAENIHANAHLLTDLYHSSLFEDRATQKDDAVTAWDTWGRLRKQLFNSKLLLKLANINQTISKKDS